MNVKLAQRMDAFKPSIFSQLAKKKQDKINSGIEIIDLSLGSPDFPPPAFIMDILASAAKDPEKYGYPLTGMIEFKEAVRDYYLETYGVQLHAENEVIQLMGSQDGLVHLPMVFADPGDIILVPDPGYTAYATGLAMSGAEAYYMPLLKENRFLPDLATIPVDVAQRAKMMILNYPGNPVPALATEAFFKEVVAFAKKYNIIVLHDFAYSEFYFENDKPVSFLSIPGAKEIGLEINSLSKSFSLAGARIGYVTGNADFIKALGQFKSNVDYGVFYPIQIAGTMALRHADEIAQNLRSIYKRRRDLLVDGLHSIGWEVDRPEGGMFIWAKIPDGWTSSELAFTLVDRANVIITPGVAFGPSGEGYVRIALVQPEEKLTQAIEWIKASGVLNHMRV